MYLNEMPLINVIDLRKNSENLARLLRGEVRAVEDLQSEIILDSLDIKDLAVVEQEVNKKLKKKYQAELKNEMISPARSF